MIFVRDIKLRHRVILVVMCQFVYVEFRKIIMNKYRSLITTFDGYTDFSGVDPEILERGGGYRNRQFFKKWPRKGICGPKTIFTMYFS